MIPIIRPLHAHLAGEVSGVDLTGPLKADQLAFSRNFGKREPTVNSNVTALADRRLIFDTPIFEQ